MKIIKIDYENINIEGKNYLVKIIYKTNKKNISFRFKDDVFVISAPLFVNKSKLIDSLKKYSKRLIKKTKKPVLICDEYVYILGKKILLDEKNKIINFTDGSQIIYSDLNDLILKLNQKFLKLVTNLVNYYTNIMNINIDFNIKTKCYLKTRYGSYSKKTKTLSFNFVLYHYDLEVIKAVVIHELSHVFVFDHSKKFYNIVNKYCPNYNQVHKRLKKGIIDDGSN